MTYRTCQQTTQPDVGWRADDQGPSRLGLLDQDRTGVTFDQLQLPVGARLDLGEKRGDAVSVSSRPTTISSVMRKSFSSWSDHGA